MERQERLKNIKAGGVPIQLSESDAKGIHHAKTLLCLCMYMERLPSLTIYWKAFERELAVISHCLWLITSLSALYKQGPAKL